MLSIGFVLRLFPSSERAIYSHSDAGDMKVTELTRNGLLLVCGVPGIDEEVLLKSTQVAR